MDISEKLAKLPDLPGVYIMRNSSGNIIYVGKAKNLKNRVRQYFHDSASHMPKVTAMVAHVADFEYIITDSEVEALCLESNLIKENRPKYNILLKDDKHYPYIKVTVNDLYPRIFQVRRIEPDGARYFGPYPSGYTVKNNIETVKKIFKLPHCSKSFPTDIGKTRPCLYYHMGRCRGVCKGDIPSDEYRESFKEICAFLDGNHKELLERLEGEMQTAAENLEYEKAATFRDKITSIKNLDASQKVISEKIRDIDIIAAAGDIDIIVFRLFYIRGGKMIGNDSFRYENAAGLTQDAFLLEFVRAYYDSGRMIPEMVVMRCDSDSAESYHAYLTQQKGKKVIVRNPVRGELAALLEMAEKNAAVTLSEYRIDTLTKNNKDKALKELQQNLSLPKLPNRIEAYDISNTSGVENVGSMVVFENGKPKKSDYKRFKIEGTVGANDYDCMKEVLSRRFIRYHDKSQGFENLPDLMLIDGGAGHLSAAREVMELLDIDIPVFGMVKDNKHRTRDLVGDAGEVSLPVVSSAFRLVTYIQDEAHRFAITYHKKLRSKHNFNSILNDIPGIGEKRRKLLMKHFKSIEKIKSAELDELCRVLDKRSAESVYRFFRQQKGEEYGK